MEGSFSQTTVLKKNERVFFFGVCFSSLHEFSSFSSLRVDLRSKLTFMQCPPTQ